MEHRTPIEDGSTLAAPASVDPSFCFLPLTQGLFALVDQSDYKRLSRFNWHAALVGGRFYAAMKIRTLTGNTTIYLHRFLISPPPGFEIDHANGFGLDDRRSNLRIATPSENKANGKKRRSNSGFRGVYFSNNRWLAQIVGKHIGSYSSPEEAAHAYDDAARLHFGPFARLNFPEVAA